MSKTTKIPYKIYLEEKDMPKEWYNVRADMKNKPAPLLNPGTLQPGMMDTNSVLTVDMEIKCMICIIPSLL